MNIVDSINSFCLYIILLSMMYSSCVLIPDLVNFKIHKTLNCVIISSSLHFVSLGRIEENSNKFLIELDNRLLNSFTLRFKFLVSIILIFVVPITIFLIIKMISRSSLLFDFTQSGLHFNTQTVISISTILSLLILLLILIKQWYKSRIKQYALQLIRTRNNYKVLNSECNYYYCFNGSLTNSSIFINLNKYLNSKSMINSNSLSSIALICCSFLAIFFSKLESIFLIPINTLPVYFKMNFINLLILILSLIFLNIIIGFTLYWINNKNIKQLYSILSEVIEKEDLDLAFKSIMKV